MFGYVRPLRAELRVKTLEQYQAGYCGLCRTLGKSFGFAARFTVSYDLLFLYLLLSGVQDPAERERCRCPARPWRCRACDADSDALRYAASLNVILTWEKLGDSAKDERGLKRLAARLGRLALKRAYRKAAAQEPDFAARCRDQMETIWNLEAAKEPSMDRHADAFAQILRLASVWFSEPELRRPVEELLGHVGRYLYLVDALEDLPKDAKKERFNPLILRFSVRNGQLGDEDKAYLLLSIRQSLNRAAAALELLPLKGGEEILHNIIYLGLPAVLQSVAEGSFRKRQKRMRSGT